MLSAIHRAQSGTLADLQLVGNAIYFSAQAHLRTTTKVDRPMPDSLDKAVAIVGVGAILPDAPDAATFWRNMTTGRYSISEVDPDRWDPALYYDPDPQAPEKTYSKLGGWVRDWDWNPLGWKLPIPPKVGEAMDDCHKWAVAALAWR